jgi:hypothetical protein
MQVEGQLSRAEPFTHPCFTLRTSASCVENAGDAVTGNHDGTVVIEHDDVAGFDARSPDDDRDIDFTDLLLGCATHTNEACPHRKLHCTQFLEIADRGIDQKGRCSADVSLNRQKFANECDRVRVPAS